MSKRISKLRRKSAHKKYKDEKWYTAIWKYEPPTLESLDESFERLRRQLQSQPLRPDPPLIMSRETLERIIEDVEEDM